MPKPRKKDALIDEMIRAYARCESPSTVYAPGPGEKTAAEKLFSPCSIGSLSLSNRCLIAPLDPIGGTLSYSRAADSFYIKHSGAGLLATPPLPADADTAPWALQPWRRLIERLHARSSRMLIQIHLDGSAPKRIADLCAAALSAGFDGVCLYARESGEDPIPVVGELRARFGTKLPILCRVSLSDALWECGLAPADGRPDLPLWERFDRLADLVRAGADALEIGLGGPETPWLLRPSPQMPAACFAEAARAVRAQLAHLGLSAAVIAFGRLDDPAAAETLLKGGACDLVSLDGAALSDEAWFQKARSGQFAAIRPADLPEYRIPSGSEKIAVIGAGCRGMNYAVLAADAGRRVELFDAAMRPGGRLALFRSQASADKEKLRSWLISEVMRRPSIKTRFRTRADLDTLRKGGYDRVVFACPPAEVREPNIPGWGEIPFVRCTELSPEALDAYRKKSVAVLGGDALACDLAWAVLSEAGAKRAALITEAPQLMPGEPEADRAWFLHHLPLRGARICTGCRPTRITAGYLVYSDGKKERHFRCDAILLAEPSPAPLRLYEEALREQAAPEIVLL